ncbi:MAG: phytoene/squalene synthase family protein [Pseudomonadota bacterium]
MPSEPGLSYCGAMLKRHDPDRYLTALFAPAGSREALFALYAFNLEIARVREAVREPLAGRVRLQWWREAIAAAAKGESHRHEVLQPLAAAMTERGLTVALMERLIDAREFDLDGEAPRDLPALLDYAEASSSTLTLLAFELLGGEAGRTPEALAAARALGKAWALTGLLRAVPFHARARRLYLPLDLLARHGVRAEDVLELRRPPGLAGVARELAGEAATQLDEARKAAPGLSRSLLPALLPGTLAGLYLKRLAQAGFDPYDVRVQTAPPTRIWRLALHNLIRRF